MELLVGDIGGAGTIFDSLDDDVSLKISKKVKTKIHYFHVKNKLLLNAIGYHLPDDEVI